MSAGLDLTGLTVSFPAGRGRVAAVQDLDLHLAPGSTLGVVGESGSGKSVTLRALMGLLPSSARVHAGILRIDGSVIPLTGRGVRGSRRGRLAMVFQDPLAALDPLMSIGEQIAEVPRRVFGQSRAAARATAAALLGQVRLSPDLGASLPHQLSGGQRQRAVIAMALACRPQILLCDEPTTALDVTIQAEILELLRSLRTEEGLSMIFVSHDLAVVSQLADEVTVMQSGLALETGSTADVIDRPSQPYTRQLLDAVLELPRPSVRPLEWPDLDEPPATVDRLLVKGISFSYPGASAPAVDQVDLHLRPGRIHGLVGESGSGKTTLARVLTGQLVPDSGTVVLDGAPLPATRTRSDLTAVQLVFQDPYASLDPRMTVRQTLSELLRVVLRLPRRQVEARCRELLAQVRLPPTALDGYPGQFSGGQRQRIAIARALAVQPRVLVADEPTSALDVSIQAAVLDLLARLRTELDLSILLISHNLAVVRQLCDDASVMLDGRIIESGPADRVLDHPGHAYTRQLIAAVPRLRRESA